MDDEEPRIKKTTHEIGEDLSDISVDELAERIDQLRAEITRLEAEIAAKTSSRSAADAAFKI